jgi:hypothetical protein
LLHYPIGNFCLILSLFPLNTIVSLLHNFVAPLHPIGNSETLFVTSFGGSDTASIIGSVTLPTIKVAILERVEVVGVEPTCDQLPFLHLIRVRGYTSKIWGGFKTANTRT